MKRINELKKGEAPTLLHTEFGNQLIQVCNAVVLAQVTPKGAGNFTVVKNRLMLNLTPKTLDIRVVANGGVTLVRFAAEVIGG